MNTPTGDLTAAADLLLKPIDMLLFCPRCHMQHVDAPNAAEGWTNPPHRSHRCHGCEHIWRQADVPTNGVAAIATAGQDDGSPVPRRPRRVADLEVEIVSLTEALRMARERERAHVESRTALHADVARLEAELAAMFPGAAADDCYYTDPARKPDPCDCPGCRTIGHGGREMPRAGAFNLAAWFDKKSRWSIETFGPGDRYDAVLAHIRMELDEIEADPGDLVEWCDVVLLAMDGATRAAGADGAAFLAALVAKQAKNVARRWPDWRTLAPGEVSVHVRDDHDLVPTMPAEVRPTTVREAIERRVPAAFIARGRQHYVKVDLVPQVATWVDGWGWSRWAPDPSDGDYDLPCTQVAAADLPPDERRRRDP